jgi:molecular chaperone GrpE
MSKKHKTPADPVDQADKAADQVPLEANEAENAVDDFNKNKLENQVTALEMKLDECRNQALRAQAEVENVRRRAERDVSNAHKYGVDKLLTDLLPVMDSMVRGLEGPDSKDPHTKTLREGMLMTLDILEKTLEKHGVEAILPQSGDAFNPDEHQAMSMVSDPDGQANTVCEVVQKGYQLNGRVLRAAMVIVYSS